jgi:superoxide reductase
MSTATQCQSDLFCGVNKPADMNNMTDLEKKHFPVVTAPESVTKGDCFEVVVEIGKYLVHPNEPGHFIEFIELYADDTYLARMDFTARTSCPVMKVCLSLDHIHEKLRAFAHCNLHGTWQGDARIKVTD